MGTAAPFGSPRPFPSKPLGTGVKGRVDFKVVGETELIANFERMRKLPQEGVTKILQILASEFMSSLVTFAPVDTGRYLRSWRVTENTPNRVVVAPVGMLPPRPTVTGGQTEPISASRLASMLEFSGSSPHVIEPKNASALVYPQGGQIKISRRVRHPGFKPIPHIRPAMNETRHKAKGISYAVAAEFMPVQAWKDAMVMRAHQEGYTGHIPPRQTGRNVKDISANIGRGTKANLLPKLSRKGFKVKITKRGSTRLVGGFEKGGSAARKVTQRKFGISG